MTPPARWFTCLSVAAALLLGASVPALAQDTTAAQPKPDSIAPGVQGSINPLRDVQTVITGDELLDASFPGSVPLFGTDVRFAINGYVKADFIKDFDYVGDPYEFELGSIAIDGSPESELGGQITFHAKESRVNFDLRSKTKMLTGKEAPLKVFIEFDWFFDTPSLDNITRLRHAYGVLGRVLAGRTWTTSGNLAALPGTIDGSGGDALYGGRVTQLRWQDNFAPTYTYAIALEEPLAEVDNPDNLPGSFRPPWPNIAGMFKWHTKAGSSAQLGVDVFPVSWSSPTTAPTVTETGYALTLMSRLVISRKEYADAFLVGGGFGKGQGAKIITLSWDGKASGVISPAGLTLNPAWFAYAGYSHYWSKRFNSTVSTNWTATDLSELQSDNTIRKAGTVHANILWFPYRLVSTGIEYMWGTREEKNGASGSASRVQFMVKWKFQ